MQIPHELIPMFITLTGARDRAKHEKKKVGTRLLNDGPQTTAE